VNSILDAKLVCDTCLKISTVGECEPDVDGDGSLGCPQPDCDGLMVQLPND
jgi:hypothetical protein